MKHVSNPCMPTYAFSSSLNVNNCRPVAFTKAKHRPNYLPVRQAAIVSLAVHSAIKEAAVWNTSEVPHSQTPRWVWIYVMDVATLLWPSPVGFPQKLQGSATNTMLEFMHKLYFDNTQQTARLRLCSLGSQPPALLSFYMSSIGCWLITNQPATEAKLETAATDVNEDRRWRGCVQTPSR